MESVSSRKPKGGGAFSWRRTRTPLVVLIATGACLGVLLWWLLRPPTCFITDMIAVDDSQVVVLARANDSDSPSRFWMVLVRIGEGAVWVEELPGAPVRNTLSVWRNMVSVRFGVRTAGSGSTVTSVTSVFDLDNGEQLWEARQPPVETESGDLHDDLLYFASQTAGEWLLEGFLDQPPGEGLLVARDWDTGQEQWRQPIPGISHSFFASQQRFAFESNAGQHHIGSLDDGSEIERWRGRQASCLIAGQFYWQARDGSFYRRALDDEEAVVVLDSTQVTAGLGEVDYVPSASYCGGYRDDLVTLIETSSHQHRIRSYDLDQGGLLWDLELGQWEPETVTLGDDATIDRSNHPIDGELTRYLPMILTCHQTGENYRWVVVDLEEGRIAREAIPQHDYLHFSHFRVNDHHYFWYHGGLLIAIDGTTGEISGALTNLAPFSHSPRHFFADRVWLHIHDWRTFDDAPVAVYDARTLTPIGAVSDDVPIQPYLDEAREMLGFQEVLSNQ